MNINNRLIVCFLGCCIFLFLNGCSQHILEATVETRFYKTKEPAHGSLKVVHPYKLKWPPPPQFDSFVVDDGVFITKMLCDFPVFLRFVLSESEQDMIYKGNYYINFKDFCKGFSSETEWMKFYSPAGVESDYDIEYRIIDMQEN